MQNPPKNMNYFSCTSPSLLKIIASKWQIFECFLPLVATFSQTCVAYSRKYVAERGTNLSKSLQKLEISCFRNILYFAAE